MNAPIPLAEQVGAASAIHSLYSGRDTHEQSFERLRLSASTYPQALPSQWITQENLRSFFELFDQHHLYAVFQPILDFRTQKFLGYEGLIRGPEGTPLNSPSMLFGLAQECGLMLEFERLCRRTVLMHYASAGLTGRLFMNASVHALSDPRFVNGETHALLEELGISASNIVIEITENQKVEDFSALRRVLDTYRARGYRIAIDDLGEGFSNLRMWSEIRPEYVKIDRHFISEICTNPLKYRLVQAMRDIAESSQAMLIAEGIETESELQLLRDMGIDYAQGYLISHPMTRPPQAPSVTVINLLQGGHLSIPPFEAGPNTTTVRQLSRPVIPLHPEMRNQDAIERFESDPDLIVIPIVESDGTPLGLLNRYSLIDRFARPYRREIYSRRPCTQFMNNSPICVDHTASVQEVGKRLSSADSHQMVDGFIITDAGRYIGLGSSQALMAMITEMQIMAARYANPLTQLPGNVPINEHIDRLLGHGRQFVACYCDLDHFKPFNDCYGYRQGDQLIQMLANLLGKHCDPRQDFVGHIGGDDFMLLMQSQDWEDRCREILKHFDLAALNYFTPEHQSHGGYHAEDRRGNAVFHPLPTLSIGALSIDSVHFHTHHEVAAAVVAAKKEAKKIRGSALFIERRHGLQD